MDCPQSIGDSQDWKGKENLPVVWSSKVEHVKETKGSATPLGSCWMESSPSLVGDNQELEEQRMSSCWMENSPQPFGNNRNNRNNQEMEERWRAPCWMEDSRQFVGDN